MLKEVIHTRQVQGEAFRRWFSSDSIDLIVWYNEDQKNITGFQLCYLKGSEEKALTWRKEGGYTHKTIDDGEGRAGRHKMSPILVPDGVFNGKSVLELFQKNSKLVDQILVEFISQKIREFPTNS